jgi:hypothetical protein
MSGSFVDEHWTEIPVAPFVSETAGQMINTSACAQREVQPDEPNLPQQIVQAEQRLEGLAQAYSEFYPAMVVAERAIWNLESQLPAEERSARLLARLVAEQQGLDELKAGGAREDNPAARLSSDRLRYLEELLTTTAD